MEIKYYRSLKNINRLSLHPILRDYNLIEHQYMTAVLFRKFASKEDVPYDINVLDCVLHHDMAEVITSDLPYTVKNFNESTSELWERIEDEVLKDEHQLNKYSDKAIKSKLNDRQHKLFKVCDLLDLWIFLKEEQGLGNASSEIAVIVERCEKILLGNFKSVDSFIKSYKF